MATTAKKEWINFQEVKRQADFGLVLTHFGITGEKKGDELRACCPFHDDKTPSFSANLEGKKFNCFGCGTSGGILEFATLANGGDPKNAGDLRAGAKAVMDICGIETPKGRKATKKSVFEAPEGAKTASGSKTADTVEKANLGDSAASQGVEKANPPLKFNLNLESEHDFFDQYGITGEQKAVFGVGYCNREKSIMYQRVCFPIHNESGELVAYAGRWAADDLPEGIKKYKLPDGFRKSLVLYNLNRVIEADPYPRHIVLVEGFWSVLRLFMESVPVVATMGTSISDAQIELLKDANVKAVTILFDGDEAGRKGADNSTTLLSRHFYTRTIDLPDGIKPDTMSDDLIAKLPKLQTK